MPFLEALCATFGMRSLKRTVSSLRQPSSRASIYKVPDYVHVEIASETFFGGVSDKRQKTVTSDSPQDKRLTLYIEASSVFGGIDIT